jgi:hypothetical protein
MSHNVIVSNACSQIAAHPNIGKIWHHYFSTQQQAAESWLDYKSQNPQATLDQWFETLDTMGLLHKESYLAI